MEEANQVLRRTFTNTKGGEELSASTPKSEEEDRLMARIEGGESLGLYKYEIVN